MEYVVVCDNSNIFQRLQTTLQQLHGGCSESRIITQQNAPHFAATLRSEGRHAVIFFASMEFSADELAILKQLCDSVGDAARVVAVGPTFGPDVILQTIRCGAVDYLDITTHFSRELENLVERVKVSRDDRSQPGRMFTIVSAVGGTGASTLAVNIAAAIAQRFSTCGLLDFQLRGGHLASLLQLFPRHTVVSLAEKVQHLDRAMFEQALIHHDSGIRLLAGPAQFADLRHFSGQVIQKIIGLARSSLTHLVVDLEDCYHAEQVRAAANSERLVIPFRLDYVSLLRTKELVDLFLGAQINRERLMLVASRCGQAKELPTHSAEEVLGMQIEHRIPNDPGSVNSSCNLGVPYVLATPRAPAAVSTVQLAEQLIGEPLADSHAVSRITTLWSKLPTSGSVQKFLQNVRPRLSLPLAEAGEG